jgi:hypothetical protein
MKGRQRDTVKTGDPTTVVTGVVTTALATIDVMRRAVKSGANMVITSGPTFYSTADSPTPPAGRGRGAPAAPPAPDPVFAAKNDFIKDEQSGRLAIQRGALAASDARRGDACRLRLVRVPGAGVRARCGTTGALARLCG